MTDDESIPQQAGKSMDICEQNRRHIELSDLSLFSPSPNSLGLPEISFHKDFNLIIVPDQLFIHLFQFLDMLFKLLVLLASRAILFTSSSLLATGIIELIDQ